MRKNNEALFELIASLTKSEKRYFKVFAKNHIKDRQNVYLKLFNAIEDQIHSSDEAYNEDKIKQQFSSEKFINQLPVTKSYLYDLILKSLRIYHASTSKTIELKNMLQDIEILYTRSLNTQCLSLIEKAKQFAHKYNKNEDLQLLNTWEQKIFLTASLKNINTYKTEGEILVNEGIQLIKETEVKNEYFSLALKMSLFIREKGFIKDKDDFKFIQQIMKHPFLQNESKINSFDKKRYYYVLWSIYYNTIRNYHKAYIYRKKLVELWNKNPILISDQFINYLFAVTNLLYTLGKLLKVNEFFIELENLKKTASSTLSSQTKIIQIQYYTNIYIEETSIYIKLGWFEKALPLVDKIKIKLKEEQTHITDEIKLLLYMNIAKIYFGLNNYDESHIWINKILNNKKTASRGDVQNFAKFMNLILHFELGNMILLQNILKSTEKSIKKTAFLYHAEKIIIEMIKKSLDIHSSTELKKLFSISKNKLLATFNDSFESQILDYFDLVSWLESKIQGKPFSNVLQETSKNALK